MRFKLWDIGGIKSAKASSGLVLYPTQKSIAGIIAIKKYFFVLRLLESLRECHEREHLLRF
jgi:hypothetical protein